MAAGGRHKKENLERALVDAEGIIAVAKRIYEKRHSRKISRRTFYDYMKRYPDLNAVREVEREVLHDDLLNETLVIARNRKHPRQSDMLQFLLLGMFKHKGHVRGLAISVSTNKIEEMDRAIRDIGEDPDKVVQNIIDEARAEKRRLHLDQAAALEDSDTLPAV